MHNMFKSVVFINDDFSNIIYGVALVGLCILGFLNFDHSQPKKIFAAVVITVALAILTLTSHDVFLLTIWLAILSFKGLDFDKLVKYDVRLKIICLIFVVALYYLGLTNSEILYKGTLARAGMGFTNPNVFSAYIMSVVTEILYLRRNKTNLFDLVMVAGASAIIAVFAGSRTQIVVMVIVALLMLANRKRKRAQKTPGKFRLFIGRNIFTIMMCLSFALVGLYMNDPTSSLQQNLNSFSSSRLRISARVINEYGVDAVGNDTFTKNEGEATIDNQYVYVVLIYGVIPLLILDFMMRKYMGFLDERRRREIYIIMVAYIISGIVEKSCLRIQYNVFMLYAAYMIYGDMLLKETKRRIRGEN